MTRMQHFSVSSCCSLRLPVLRRVAAVACSVGLAGALAVGLPGSAKQALASGGSAQLVPAAGQYFPITPVKVLDTRDGTGGVPTAPLVAATTVSFQVGGMGQVPDGGVADAYVIINAISPQHSGCLNDYSADVDNPNICTVSFEPGQNVSDADIVAVSSSGFVSVTNESGGTVNVAVTVMGYYQNGDLATNVPSGAIVDTRNGTGGVPATPVPAGGSITFSATLVDASAVVATTDANGASCGYTVNRSVNNIQSHIEFLGQFNDAHTVNGIDTVGWLNKVWALPNARVNVTTRQHQPR